MDIATTSGYDNLVLSIIDKKDDKQFPGYRLKHFSIGRNQNIAQLWSPQSSIKT